MNYPELREGSLPTGRGYWRSWALWSVVCIVVGFTAYPLTSFFQDSVSSVEAGLLGSAILAVHSWFLDPRRITRGHGGPLPAALNLGAASVGALFWILQPPLDGVGPGDRLAGWTFAWFAGTVVVGGVMRWSAARRSRYSPS